MNDPLEKIRFMQMSAEHDKKSAKRAVFEDMKAGGLEEEAHFHGRLCRLLGDRTGGGYCNGYSFGRDEGLAEICEGET